MTPTEEYYLKIRNKLDDLGYLQPLSFESVLLVDKLLEDLLNTKKGLQHYKNVAQQSMEACSELQAGVGPFKVDNAKLIKENNDLRQKLLKSREAIEDTKVELRKEIRRLEKERTLQEYLCTQHASKITQLQTELAQKSAKLMEYRGVKNKVHATGPNKKREEPKVDKEQMLEKAQEKINHLTKEITKLRSEQEELDEVIESLKNKVNVRDAEIERLTQLLTDGRPLMAARNQCPCCSPQLLDCRLLAKNKQLSEQLEETKQKQHEAMIRAMELAEKNQILEEKRIPSTQTPRSDSSKKCCCAENSNKICKLQEKLEERILQVERLEQELTELKMTNANVLSDKLSVDKILEITLEDKKRMHDRINELTIIEHDLMLEIERLQRTNALQKSQLAELEAQATESVRVAESNRVTQVSKPNSVKATARPGASC
uniref:Uncharacterized protein n=1 Tax=Homalodisca liturata TaxID=320908 RepID=A0A1B6JRV7_9HEMI